MRKSISVLLLVITAALCLTGCAFGKGETDGKRKTVGAVKIFIPEGWEADTAHSGKSSDDYSVFIKKDGYDNQYIWIRVTDEAGVTAAMDRSISDETDDFETGKFEWEGNKDLVWSENKGNYFLAFAYGLDFKDAQVQEILSSLKVVTPKEDNGNIMDGDGMEKVVTPDDIEEPEEELADDLIDDTTDDMSDDMDPKAKYDGTWYGYWSFGNCTGKFESSSDAYFNCFCIFDMNDDGTGSFTLYNTWDEVGGGTVEAASEGRLICTSATFLGAPMDDWIFYPARDKENMLSVDDSITDADGDVLEFSFYVRPWGQSWKDMEDSYVYKNLIVTNEEKVDRGEDPPIGHSNPTYFN